MRYRPLFHELLARELAQELGGGYKRPTSSAGAPSRERAPAFVKVHDAYLHVGDGAALFPQVATSGVVYLVRNPLTWRCPTRTIGRSPSTTRCGG